MNSIDKVETYTIKNNLINTSTDPMPILDENNNVIGHVGLFYNSIGEKILGCLSGRPIFYHLLAKDADGNIRTRVNQFRLFFKRAKWNIEMYPNPQEGISFLVRDISDIGAAKTLAFEYNGHKIIMENNHVHYQSRFTNSSNDLIAQCDRIPESLSIQVFKPELDIYLIATLALIQYYWSIIS